MDLNELTDDVFRETVRDFVEANYPPELRNPPHRLHWNEAKPWYMALSRQGWLAPSWPQEHGGMGLSAAKQLIMMEEFERHGVARTPDHGLVLLGPLLIRYGTEAQKQRFLPRILAGEDIWCQGYSEPGAGSDLGRAAHGGGAGRRALGGQRPEDLDHAGVRRQLDFPIGAHGQDRQEAGRHFLPARPAGQPRRDGAPDHQPRTA